MCKVSREVPRDVRDSVHLRAAGKMKAWPSLAIIKLTINLVWTYRLGGIERG